MRKSKPSGSSRNFDTSWDIEKYHSPHEPPIHWELKKKFMVKNKFKFPEARLVCLASTFANVEFLGCSYNPQTMKLLDKLSKGIVEEFREKKKQSGQKGFLDVSDTADSKIQEGKSDSKMPIKELTTEAAQVTEGLEQACGGGCAEALSTVTDEEKQQIMLEPECHDPTASKKKHRTKNARSRRAKTIPLEFIPEECQTCYGNLVLIEDEGANIIPRQVIERSSNLCHASILVREAKSAENEVIVTIYISGKLIASAKNRQAKKARELAYQSALKKLQEVCYTIKVKNKQYNDPLFEGINDANGKKPGNSSATVKGEASGGTQKKVVCGKEPQKMMKTGVGQGKTQQGITEPVRAKTMENKSDAGRKLKNLEGKTEVTIISPLRKKAAMYLQAYAETNTEKDLIFSTEFSNEEQKILHQLSSKFDLRSRSYGKQGERYLVISKKIEPFSLVRNLLTPEYKSLKYELVEPTGPKGTR